MPNPSAKVRFVSNRPDKASNHVGPNTLQEVTGGFLATLTGCQMLLIDNSQFHQSSAHFIDSIVWWSATEREVIALRDRVALDVINVTFIATPFETQLLLGNHRESQQLRRDVADLRGRAGPECMSKWKTFGFYLYFLFLHPRRPGSAVY